VTGGNAIDARMRTWGRMGKGNAVALAAPGCLLAVVITVLLSMAAGGRDPLWTQEPLNLSEAAGVRDEGEVARLIENGSDAAGLYLVRPGIVFRTPTWLTPLEQLPMTTQ